jgi:hypothetical protein
MPSTPKWLLPLAVEKEKEKEKEKERLTPRPCHQHLHSQHSALYAACSSDSPQTERQMVLMVLLPLSGGHPYSFQISSSLPRW